MKTLTARLRSPASRDGLLEVQFKARQAGWKAIRYLLILGIAFIILYPLIIKAIVALMSEQDLNDLTVKWVPKHPTWENFQMAFRVIRFPAALQNTVFVSTIVTVLQIASCTFASYSFARLTFPGSRIVFGLMVITLMVPPQTYMIAMYSQFRFFDPFGLISLMLGQQGLIGTYWPMMIRGALASGIRNGLFIYILTQFFRNVPVELEEAAHVDGAGVWRTFWSIMLPNAKPAIVTVTVFSLVWQWNDSFYSSLFMPGMDMLAANLASVEGLIKSAQQGLNTQSPALFSAVQNAASLLTVLPLVVLFIVAQRFFVENLERSGIVG